MRKGVLTKTLIAIIISLSIASPLILAPTYAGTNPVVILTFDDGYSQCYNVTREILADYDAYATYGIITDYVTNGSDWENCSVMTWAQVETLDEEGHEIASHSASHINALHNCSASELTYEVKNSRDAIYDNLGYYPTSFLYPHGYYNETVIDELIKYGYDMARTTEGLATWTSKHYFDGDDLKTGNRWYEIPAHTSTIGGPNSYNAMKDKIDEAISSGKEYCGLILHRVLADGKATDQHVGDLSASNLTATLDYAVNTKGLTVTSLEKGLQMEFMSYSTSSWIPIMVSLGMLMVALGLVKKFGK